MIRLFQSGASWQEAVMMLMAVVVVAFIASPIHECAHAFVAYKQGDPTAKNLGRLTLNPLKHIDPIGGLMILLLGFGYAKPVPINMNNFEHPKRGMALSALAGPVSNLILAFLFMLISSILNIFLWNVSFWIYLYLFFYYCIIINLNLAVFNLLPIPPLDGSRIVNSVLPDRIYYKLMDYERIIQMLLFVLLFTGVLSYPLGLLNNLIYNGMEWLVNLIVGIF